MPSFDRTKIGDVRPNQMITTFGPDAIVDVIRDSVTILDTSYWQEKGEQIADGRLASYLGVNYFYKPKSQAFHDVPAVSFPYSHICSDPKCGHIFDIREYFNIEQYMRQGVNCPLCHKPAYPSRFIVMCASGHMDDFPWRWWVHKGNCDCKKKLYLRSTGRTSTLGDMIVKCDCGATRTMSGATQSDNFTELTCTGHHPFKPSHRNEKCKTKKVIPSQRGASNVYFPVIKSAISIPPWINPLFNLIDMHLRDIEILEGYGVPDPEGNVYNKYFADNYSREEFDETLKRRRENIKEFTEIKQMEYNAITHHDDPLYASNRRHFKAEEDELPTELKKYFSRVIRITRMREVKVLLGFTRVEAPDPDADTQDNIVYLSKTPEKWLPAVDINGEGVFIEFNEATLKTWLKKPEVAALSKKYADSYDEYCRSRGWVSPIPRDGKYVLMHTFAHLLIKEMSLKSGYSSSAIRERIYSTDKMSGILLYTGSADKEGSLGGLVELGKYARLIPLIQSALENALVCTNDPECLSNLPTSHKSNGAACHSCCMISETACENGNRLLDRAFVVPLNEREEQSYFRELVSELCHLEV